MTLTSLSGIIPPMVTPLRERDALDEAGLERLVERLLAGGSSGLFLLGTTGEGPALSRSVREALVARTCRLVNRRAPALVCVSDASFTESVSFARFAADAGADAIVAAAPFYWPLGQEELVRYYERLASESPLPLLLYNMPALTKVALAPETVARVMQHPGVVGMKDSSGSVGYLHQILRLRRARPEWRVFAGDEDALPWALLAGADGGVNGGANLWPRLYTRCYQAAAAADLLRLRELLPFLLRMGDLYRIGGDASSAIRAIKYALHHLGVCEEAASEPFAPLNGTQRAQAASIVEELRAAEV